MPVSFQREYFDVTNLSLCCMSDCKVVDLLFVLEPTNMPPPPRRSFVLGAVSPAVVVPSMLLLQKEGYGVEQGIPTLLMAAGSFDDILAITGFTTCLGMAFATGTLAHGCGWSTLRGNMKFGQTLPRRFHVVQPPERWAGGSWGVGRWDCPWLHYPILPQP